ncbi:NDP-hexose 2,3-dehydratase family protein [Sphingomonas sp. 37zxx]|uniref:NDP-hexose 2,3-dehydratase family protein n=1 Tax=Sphingomonas sp. 37zxx TaxID=1550073 RepID=UPI00068B7943|nr:NDP-hexose 2,3-dehydratase family protein [Sphingomonas sp. 37zxx]
MSGDRARQDEEAILRSALTSDSAIQPLATLPGWIERQSQRLKLETKRIPFDALDQWRWLPNPVRLAHVSGKFFEMEGIRVESEFGACAAWEQPIIRQPEIGNLGIIAQRLNGVLHFLLQAKVEPGNINGIQLSPTEQATRSNYLQVHNGQAPPFHAYFQTQGKGRVLADRLLGEHGHRFLRKRNRNVIVEVDAETDPFDQDGFCWLTLGQIKQLMRQDNLINMSTRSVLSCLPLSPWAGRPRMSMPEEHTFEGALIVSLYQQDRHQHTTGELLNWLASLRARNHFRTYRRPLDQLEGWRCNDTEITSDRGTHDFSVIAVSVTAGGREVRSWSQPMIHHVGIGTVGFLCSRIKGVMHLLVRACLPPGGDTSFELGPTLCVSAGSTGAVASDPIAALFVDPSPESVRHNSIQSEEGGRLSHYRSRYLILEVPSGDMPVAQDDARWMTLGQLAAFNHFGMVNMEARNLLACLDFCPDPIAAPIEWRAEPADLAMSG